MRWPSRTQEEQFFSHVTESDSGCWEWDKPNVRTGYGQFGANKKVGLAHRWIYGHMRAEIPDGLDLDHLCRNRRCVNPWHLEPVSRQENIRREHMGRPTCVGGHPWTSDTTYVTPDGRRQCRPCIARRSRLSKSRKRK